MVKFSLTECLVMGAYPRINQSADINLDIYRELCLITPLTPISGYRITLSYITYYCNDLRNKYYC